jgi:hypothetical protein
MSLAKFTLRWWADIVFPLLFIATGWCLLPYPGLQTDEVVFVRPQFNLPGAALFEARIRQHTIALMLLTYLGSLKSLQFFEPSYISVRLPVILLGGLTVWPVVRLVELMHGRRAAWIAGSSSPPIPPSFSPLASTGDQWRSNTS